jgi:hypothetical protein
MGFVLICVILAIVSILQVAPPSPDLLRQYVELAKAANYPALHGSPTNKYIFITDEKNALIAAVTIYPTDGVYILFEDFLLSQKHSLRLRHRATHLLGEQIIAHCTTNGKIPVCAVLSPGAVKILRKLGFEGVEAAWMRRMPDPLPLDEV